MLREDEDPVQGVASQHPGVPASQPPSRPAAQPLNVPASFRHLTGLRAAATVGVGLALGAWGAALAARAAHRPEGWGFLALAATACLLACPLLATLPWRLTTQLDDTGIRLGWALGRRLVPWPRVRRVVAGTLGSGGERDPATVNLLLRDGSEILYAVLGRQRPEDVDAVRSLREVCRQRGIRWDDSAAPLDERREREQTWRQARLKGWR
ncbi:MAG: hypothetical protein HY900_12475 [Deltaproteobacteria bacterium]|nr:hypothetical protein [Deltaproteobacteria bacterium]